MKLISLGRGRHAKVDDEDYEWLNQWKWHYNGRYAVRHSPSELSKTRKHILMHRLIANTPEGMETDHIDQDGLDNQRNNLRHCTQSQNRMNVGAYANNTSGFKGVTWHKKTRKWRATIKFDGKKIALGLFVTAEEAARAYDEAALKYHGEFARLNADFRKEGEPSVSIRRV